MNKKAMLSILGLYAASSMIAMETASAFTGTRSGTNDGSYGHGIPDKAPVVIPKGCSEFNIGGFKVIALNRKSAEKKANKLHKKRLSGNR